MKPKPKAQHTPTPWIYEKLPDTAYFLREEIDRKIIADHMNEANATFAARAVNCHEEFFDIANMLLRIIKDEKLRDKYADEIEITKAAIAKAEEE